MSNTSSVFRRRPGYLRFVLSLVAALSLAVIGVLVAWNFQLGSLRKFVLLTAVTTLISLPLCYGWILRGVREWKPIRLMSLWLPVLAVALVALLAVPAAPSRTRYFVTLAVTIVASLGLVFSLSSSCLLQNSENRMRITLGLLIAGGAAGMAIFLFNSLSVRLYSDDWCYANTTRAQGYFQAAIWFYKTWSGRFFSNFLVMGMAGWRWATLAQLAAILMATFLGLLALTNTSKKYRVLVSLAGSLWIPFAVFSIIPDVYKSLYWIVSSLVVLPILVLIPVYAVVLALSLKPCRSKIWLSAGLILLLSFMIATTHEASVLGWLFIQGAALLWAWRFARGRKNLLVLLGAGLIAALIGLAVELLSPGALNRGVAQGYTQTTTISGLAAGTAVQTVAFLRSITAPGWMMLLATAFLGWILPASLPRNAKAALVVPVLTLAVVAACTVPGVYAMSGAIPLRSQLIPAAYLAYGLFLMGMLLPRPEEETVLVALCAVFLILAPVAGLQNVRRVLPTIAPMQQFARDWDARDSLMRSSQINIKRIPIPWDEYEQLKCAQRYYTLRRSDPSN